MTVEDDRDTLGTKRPSADGGSSQNGRAQVAVRAARCSDCGGRGSSTWSRPCRQEAG